MTRINLFRATPATASSVAWGKINFAKNVLDTRSPYVFGALLIACSLAVGCSSEKQKPVIASNESPITQPTPTMTSTPTPVPVAPVQPTTSKPAHRKVVRKAPPTVTYADKTTGVSFQYRRGYALKTGDAATELVVADSIPMDFTQPGGTALAAVSLPDSAYPHSDLASAYFDVSVNKTLTADQCGEFSVPQVNPAIPSDASVQATAQLATPPISKLLIGDMELKFSETSTGDETEKGTREESSRYYHVFQNGACYEFALKVATLGADPTQKQDSEMKHVDRDEVFHRLERILATVKINPVTTTETNVEAKTTPTSTPAETPAQ